MPALGLSGFFVLNPLQRSWFREAFMTSLGALVGMVLVLWAVPVLELLDQASQGQISRLATVQLAFLKLFETIGVIFPTALATGCALALGRRWADSELPVAYFCGLSPTAVAMPLLLLALLAGLVAVGFNLFATSKIDEAYARLEARTKSEAIVQRIEPNRSQQLGGGWYGIVGAVEGNRMMDATLFKYHVRGVQRDIPSVAMEIVRADEIRYQGCEGDFTDDLDCAPEVHMLGGVSHLIYDELGRLTSNTKLKELHVPIETRLIESARTQGQILNLSFGLSWGAVLGVLIALALSRPGKAKQTYRGLILSVLLMLCYTAVVLALAESIYFSPLLVGFCLLCFITMLLVGAWQIKNESA